MVVLVPGEFAFEFSELDVLAIKFSCYTGVPVITEKREFFGKVYFFDAHIRQLPNGSYILGATAFGFNGGDFFLIKTNSTGDTLWTKNYGGSGFERLAYMQNTNDGGFIMSGWSNSFDTVFYAYIVKTDGAGDTLWTKIYPQFGELIFSLEQTADGGYIMVTTIGSQLALAKTDAMGNITWTKLFRDAPQVNAYYWVQQTSDGGYALVGFHFA